MSENVAQILDQIGQLSQEERAELAYAFVCSLEPEDEGAEAAWDAELRKRLADIRAGRAVGKSSEHLFEEMSRDH